MKESFNLESISFEEGLIAFAVLCAVFTLGAALSRDDDGGASA